MQRKIVKVGASLCVLLPKKVTEKVGWDFDDYVDLILDEEEQKVTIKDYEESKDNTQLTDFAEFKENYQEAFNIDENDNE